MELLFSFFSVIVLVLFFKAYRANYFFVSFTERLAAAGTLVILLAIIIPHFSYIVYAFRTLFIIIAEKGAALIAIDKFTFFLFFIPASGTIAVLLSFKINYPSFRWRVWHFSPLL